MYRSTNIFSLAWSCGQHHSKEKLFNSYEKSDHIFLNEVKKNEVLLGHTDPYNHCQKDYNEFFNVLFLGELYKADVSLTPHKNDASIIIQLFEKYGFDAFSKLNGSYVFILFDKRKNEIVIVRDNMGTIPMYYSSIQDRIVFSNGINTILQFHTERRINEKCLPEYLLFRYVSESNTLFDGIYELMPGEYAVVKDNGIKKNRFYKCKLSENNYYKDEMTEMQQLDNILTDCTTEYLNKYNDVSILLSGGLDSSYLAHKIRDIVSTEVKSFTVGFSKEEYNEVKYAEWVKNKYDFNHMSHYISEQEYFDNYVESIYIHEEPINHPSTVSLNIISRLAYENGARTFISGEGADSVLGSSPNIFLSRVSQLNKPVKNMFIGLIKNTPDFLKPEKLVAKQTKILNALKIDTNIFPVMSSAYADIEWLEKVMQHRFEQSIISSRFDIYNTHAKSGLINGYLGLTQETSLVSSLKMFNKMTLANGIRFQTPFMDNRVVSFLNDMQAKYKFHGRIGKYLFKKLCEQNFPNKFIYRPKYGFGVPLEDWLLNKKLLGKYVDILLDQKSLERGFYNKKRLRELINLYQNKRMPDASYEGLLWTILNLEIWIRLFIEDCSI